MKKIIIFISLIFIACSRGGTVSLSTVKLDNLQFRCRFVCSDNYENNERMIIYFKNNYIFRELCSFDFYDKDIKKFTWVGKYKKNNNLILATYYQAVTIYKNGSKSIYNFDQTHSACYGIIKRCNNLFLWESQEKSECTEEYRLVNDGNKF